MKPGAQLGKFAGGAQHFLVCYHLVCLLIYLVSIAKYTRGGVSGGAHAQEIFPKIFFKLRFRIGAFW